MNLSYFILKDDIYIFYKNFMIVNDKIYKTKLNANNHKVCFKCEAGLECNRIIRYGRYIGNENWSSNYICSIANNFEFNSDMNFESTNELKLVHVSYIRANLFRQGRELNMI